MLTFLLHIILTLSLGGWLACRMLRRVPVKSRAGKFSLGVVVVCLFAYASTKMSTFTGPSDPHSDPWQFKPPDTLSGNGSGSYWESIWDDLLALIPPAWWPSGWPKNDFEGDLMYDKWERRMFSDPLVHDSFEDRAAKGYPQIVDFILWLDPRSHSTLGQICGDAYLLANGLNPLVYWDQAVWSNGVSVAEMFLRGLPLDWNPAVTNLNEWLERGLEYGKDAWPEGEDEVGDVTLVSIRVEGPAAAFAVVANRRHCEPAKRAIALDCFVPRNDGAAYARPACKDCIRRTGLLRSSQ